MSGCGGCSRRRDLLTRTFTKLLPRRTASTPVVNVSAGGVNLTPRGYVAKCKYCLEEGVASPTPEKAVLTCECKPE